MWPRTEPSTLLDDDDARRAVAGRDPPHELVAALVHGLDPIARRRVRRAIARGSNKEVRSCLAEHSARLDKPASRSSAELSRTVDEALESVEFARELKRQARGATLVRRERPRWATDVAERRHRLLRDVVLQLAAGESMPYLDVRAYPEYGTEFVFVDDLPGLDVCAIEAGLVSYHKAMIFLPGDWFSRVVRTGMIGFDPRFTLGAAEPVTVSGRLRAREAVWMEPEDVRSDETDRTPSRRRCGAA